MPVIDSIEVAAIAIPYRPSSVNAPQIARHTAMTGSAVAFIDTPSPAMMLVAWPVSEAAATLRTGAYSVAGEDSGIIIIAAGSPRPRGPHPSQRPEPPGLS